MVTFGLVTWLGEHGLPVWRSVAFAVALQLLIASVYTLRLLRPLPRMGVADSTTKGTGLAWVPTAGRVALAFGLAWVAFLALGVAIEAASYAVGALICATSPNMIVFLAGIVALIVLSIMLPILQINQLAIG